MKNPNEPRLKEMFTPNSRPRISLAEEGRYCSGNDNMQLRIFTNDEGEALHMGVVAAPPKPKRTLLIDFQKNAVPQSNLHPVLAKASVWFYSQADKLSLWAEKHFPRQKTTTTYRSSYQVR